jgi:hypothetical protein
MRVQKQINNNIVECLYIDRKTYKLIETWLWKRLASVQEENHERKYLGNSELGNRVVCNFVLVGGAANDGLPCHNYKNRNKKCNKIPILYVSLVITQDKAFCAECAEVLSRQEATIMKWEKGKTRGMARANVSAPKIQQRLMIRLKSVIRYCICCSDFILHKMYSILLQSDKTCY